MIPNHGRHSPIVDSKYWETEKAAGDEQRLSERTVYDFVLRGARMTASTSGTDTDLMTDDRHCTPARK